MLVPAVVLGFRFVWFDLLILRTEFRLPGTGKSLEHWIMLATRLVRFFLAYCTDYK
jgi:hypothetical protein